MNFLQRKVKEQVSKGRNRFRHDGFDLDLGYILPRLLAMGIPSSGVEARFRNHVDDVARLLDRYHADQYMVFNVSERKYDYTKLHNNVIEMGWLDHHAPPLARALQVCHAVHSWITQDAENVAVVHCVAGKGRTGVAVACYLLYSGVCKTAEEAVNYFSSRRGRGISYPCQKRCVSYVQAVLGGFRPATSVLRLRKVHFSGVPNMDGYGGCNPWFEIYFENTRLIFSNKGKTGSYSVGDSHMVLVCDVNVRGDLLFRFKHGSSGRTMFRTQFHTGFVPRDGTPFRLTKKQLDGPHKESKYKDNFYVDFYFEEADDPRLAAAATFPWQTIADEHEAVIKRRDTELVMAPTVGTLLAHGFPPAKAAAAARHARVRLDPNFKPPPPPPGPPPAGARQARASPKTGGAKEPDAAAEAAAEAEAAAGAAADGADALADDDAKEALEAIAAATSEPVAEEDDLSSGDEEEEVAAAVAAIEEEEERERAATLAAEGGDAAAAAAAAVAAADKAETAEAAGAAAAE